MRACVCVCWGVTPITVRPPNMLNLTTTLPTVRMVVEVSRASAVLSTAVIIRVLRSKVPHTTHTHTAVYRRRPFIVLSGPRLWNSLPLSLRKISSYGQFRRYLKNHLFGIWEITEQCDTWYPALYKYSYLLTYLLTYTYQKFHLVWAVEARPLTRGISAPLLRTAPVVTDDMKWDGINDTYECGFIAMRTRL